MALNGARDSGAPSKPATAAVAGARPVTVTVCGTLAPLPARRTQPHKSSANECLAINEPRFDGRSANRSVCVTATHQSASLREDYLIQVQRDFLSRALTSPAPLAIATRMNAQRRDYARQTSDEARRKRRPCP